MKNKLLIASIIAMSITFNQVSSYAAEPKPVIDLVEVYNKIPLPNIQIHDLQTKLCNWENTHIKSCFKNNEYPLVEYAAKIEQFGKRTMDKVESKFKNTSTVFTRQTKKNTSKTVIISKKTFDKIDKMNENHKIPNIKIEWNLGKIKENFKNEL